MTWSQFNSQFRETDYERRQRWRDIKAKRRAEGKCWQCAKPLPDAETKCDCGADQKPHRPRSGTGQ